MCAFTFPSLQPKHEFIHITFYSLYDLSRYLHIPYSTLHLWRTQGAPLFTNPGGVDGNLNFCHVVEAFAVRHLRTFLSVSMVRAVQGECAYALTRKPVLEGVGRDVWTETHIRTLLDWIVFAEDGFAMTLYPWGCPEGRNSVRIDPRFRFGQPTPVGCSVPVRVIQERILLAGESPVQVATDYGISEETLQDCLAYARPWRQR